MFNNPMEMIQSFMEFQKNFKGDPEAEVQNLLQSGRMNQKQLNKLQKMARQFQQLLGSLR